MRIIVNTKLGQNRGNPRIWLEGQKLAVGGFVPGIRFNIQMLNDKLTIQIAEDGRYKISSRTRNGVTSPILDLNNESLNRLFFEDSKLRVAIKQGLIVVSAHASASLKANREKRLLDKLATQQPLAVCSLFHGGGVLDKAIHSGFQQNQIRASLAVAVEIEPQYLDASLRNNGDMWNADSIVLESSIEDLQLDHRSSQVDVLIAGIPCTGASKAGRSKNKLQHAESHASAGAMFYHFLKFVEYTNPAIILIENVPEYANTASMEVIRSVLSSLQYQYEERIFDSSEFGVIEKRKRLCLLAVSNGLGFDATLSRIESGSTNSTQINEILDPIPFDDAAWKAFDYLAQKEIRDKAAGKGFKRQLLSGHETSCGTIGRDYAKCRSTEPFLIHPTDPSLSRIFTPQEHARIKGIPTSVIEGLSNTIAHQILGQSVAYPVFQKIGAAIAKQLKTLPTALKALSLTTKGDEPLLV